VRDAFAGQTAFELATQESAPADVLSLLRPPTPAGGPLLAVLPGRGHVATAAVLELARDLQGCRVRVVVRDVEKKDEVERLLPAADDRLQVVVADLSDYASVLAALQGADRVLLSPPSAPDREALATAGIEAARACGAQHLVMVSVAGCGAGEEGRVAVWDEFARLEAAARGSGVPCTFMRAGEFMENLLGGGAAAGQIAGNQGDGRVASVCAADVGAACAAVLRQGPAEHAGKAYVLTGPGALSKPEVAQVLSEVLGLQVEYVDLSPEEHAARLRGWQVPEFVVQIVVDLQEAYKLGAESAAVSGDLMELIGRQTSLREFAETHKDALLG
jgi:NAD(P)H dehydrogenase (quinone)